MKNISKSSLVLFFIFIFFSAFTSIAQNCKPESIQASTPTKCFYDNGNGTITDQATGLMWKKCIEGYSGFDCVQGSGATFTWQNALKRAQDINNSGGFAGYTDWRIPNIKELASIVENQCYDPSINLSVFPGTSLSFFWSSSAVIYNGGVAWCVDFRYGGDGWGDKSNDNYVRLVRGGQ